MVNPFYWALNMGPSKQKQQAISSFQKSNAFKGDLRRFGEARQYICRVEAQNGLKRLLARWTKKSERRGRKRRSS